MGISALRWKGECRIWGSTKEKPTIWFSQSCNPAVLISHPWLGPSWKNNGLYSQKPLPLCCLVTKSCPTLWHHELQHARLLCPSLSHGVCSNSCPLSQWWHPTISSTVPSSPPALNRSQHQGLFQWVSCLHQVANALELQLQHQSFQWIFRTHFL